MNQPQPNYDWAIFQVDRMFNVKDIMTGSRDLTYADSIEQARQRSATFDYDVVPIGDSNNLHRFFERDTDSVQEIKKENILAGDTGIAALMSYLEKSGFYFVLEYDSIVGFVNRSDLNKLLSFLPVYATSLYAESAMREYFRREQQASSQNYQSFLSGQFGQISNIVDNNGLSSNFNFQELDKKFSEAKKKGFYTDIYDEFEFWQELALYYFLKSRLSSQDDWDKVKNYKEIRNRTMHIKDQLSYSNAKANLSQLLSFLQECTNIIREVFP
jgi:hypothetical protein